MISLMKYNGLLKFNILEVISNYESLLKCSSTQILKDQNAADKAVNKGKKKKKLFIPSLTEEKLKGLKDITTIAIEMNHVSWAKMSTLNFTLLEWNALELPKNFRYDMNEFQILNLENFVQQKIPSSDLYVIEHNSNYGMKFNELYLKIALLIHIGNFNKDSEIYDNIVFQHPKVLNDTYKLLVGRERRSTKQIVENIFSLQEDRNNNTDNIFNIHSINKISEETIQNFASFSRAKQESLSLALLINLSFFQLNFFQNQENYIDRNIFDLLTLN